MTENSQKSEKLYGFDLYPQRRSAAKPTFWEKLNTVEASDLREKMKCEKNVTNVFENNLLVKILTGALKKAGCPVNLRRHIVCEKCDTCVTGGYDSEFNQIVICQNHFKSRNAPEAVLVHELIHMYDYCVGQLDFKDPEHLACTEIRAANISHCSFLSSFFLGQSSPINIKRTHQYCVKLKAAQSMQLARNMDFPTAMGYILKVFDRCYNDLEPIGRRLKRNSDDFKLAYREGEHFGVF